MPVVDTTQTFNTGDTVTSTSLNNIMDQSVFIPGAVVTGDGLTVTAGGQMTIENLKITGAKIGDLEITAPKLSGAQTGSAPIFGVRAWVNFDALRDSTGATNNNNTARFIRSSGNVTSVTKTATGKYTVAFTTPMNNSNYLVVCNSGSDTVPRLANSVRSSATSSSVGIQTENNSFSAADFVENNVIIIG
jgi:hypothetical protein